MSRLPRTMQAWRVETITDAGQMHLREMDLPPPGPDEMGLALPGVTG